MNNITKAAQEKIEKLQANRLKWEGIFEKSETTRAASVANLELALAKKKKMADQIAAKKAKTLASIDAKILAAQNEADGIVTSTEEQAAEAQVLAELEAEEMTKEFYSAD